MFPSDPADGAGTGVSITPIAAFADNYIWLLQRGDHAVVVDPGDAAPVLAALQQRQCNLDAIVVTHHHADHVGGVAHLEQAFGATVYGPARSPYAPIGVRLRDGDRATLLGLEFGVFEVPGHTLDHIALFSPELEALFCGDTLFACGCGRLFEGTAEQMHASLDRIGRLPDATRIYCAHEYTSANIRFALAVEPDNVALVRRSQECARLRQQGLPTVPSDLALERATNPFLRCDQATVRAAVIRQRPGTGSELTAIFAALRGWKDGF